MSEVEERVDRLEITLERFIRNADAINQRIDQNIVRLDQNIQRLDQNIVRLDRNFERLDQNIQRLDRNFERLDQNAQRLDRNFERLDQNIQRLDRNFARLDQNIQRLDRNFARLEENGRRLEENGRRLEENGQRLEENGQRLDRNFERLDQNVKRLDQDLAEQKRAAREHALEMARIADRIGRFSEDIVAPNVPRIAREAFGIEQVDFSGQRVEKRPASSPSKLREFDCVIAGNRQLLITEVKSTARLKYIEDFAAVLKDIFEYFPEYKGWAVRPVFASLGLSPDFVRRLTRLRIYAMALGDRTMELLNLPEVSAKANGGSRGHR